MRAKQSSTASGIFSRTGPLTAPIPILVAAPIRSTTGMRGTSWVPRTEAAWGSGIAQGEGLLHDARNLMGALGLYCDLLSLPGVLKPEHLHYATELRLLSTRSGTLMERLMPAPSAFQGDSNAILFSPHAGAPAAVLPISLREIAERCIGLLGRVAGDRTIEMTYGPAASTAMLAGQEDIERILVNLVRNAAAALDARAASTKRGNGPAGDASPGTSRSTVRQMQERTSDHDQGAIRIGMGLLQNRVGDSQPWPFRRVRLTVEDSGIGMTPEHLERLMQSGRAPSRGGHGIGFCVVRELVAAGGGDLRVMSALGLGTRVQIEWPVALVNVDATETGCAPASATGTRSRHSVARSGRGTAC